MTTPHWEHGYRYHCLWLNGRRLAAVGLTPPGFPVVYSWSIDGDSSRGGECKTLRQAKRAAEKALEQSESRGVQTIDLRSRAVPVSEIFEAAFRGVVRVVL